MLLVVIVVTLQVNFLKQYLSAEIIVTRFDLMTIFFSSHALW